MPSDDDDYLRVYQEEADMLWPLPTRILDPNSRFRAVMLIPAVHGPSSEYMDALRATLATYRPDRRRLTVQPWGTQGVVVTVSVDARRLADAMRLSGSILFALIADAGESPPDAVGLFVAGRGTRFFRLDHRLGWQED